MEMLQRSYKEWGYVKAVTLDLARPEAVPAELSAGFDSVVSFQVLEHIKDDAVALGTISRLLKPKGRVLLMLPAHQALFGTLDRELSHFRRYDEASLRGKLEAAGFEVEALRFFNPVAVPGWWLNGRILRRRLIPDFQLAVFENLIFLVRWLARWDIRFGLVIFAVGRKKA